MTTRADLLQAGDRGCFTPVATALEGEWILRARQEVEAEPGTPVWAHALLRWYRRYVVRSRETYRHPVMTLAAGHGRFDQQSYALAWLAMEAFGEQGGTRHLVHVNGTSKHTVAVVGPDKWVLDPWYARAYAVDGKDGGDPVGFDALLQGPAWLSAYVDTDGLPMTGYFRPEGVIPYVDGGTPPPPPKGYGWV